MSTIVDEQLERSDVAAIIIRNGRHRVCCTPRCPEERHGIAVMMRPSSDDSAPLAG
jgi:hypothetical protein